MDQNEYVNYKNEVEKWLDNANKIIEKCNNIQNLDDINSNLNEINVSSKFQLTNLQALLPSQFSIADPIESCAGEREDH